MGKISEEKNNTGDNNEERDTFNEDIKESSNRVRLRKPKKKVSLFINCIGVLDYSTSIGLILSHARMRHSTCE